MEMTTAMMDALVIRKRAERDAINPRLNVHFLREDGTPDVFSFADIERADKFRAALIRQGRTILEGN